MRRACLVLAGLALVVCSACAQDDDPLAPGLQLLRDLAQSRILTLEIKELHDRIREDVVRSAERMPAEHFDFQPTPDVRTFGQLVGHVATNLYVMCAAAGAENNPHPALVEQTVFGKADPDTTHLAVVPRVTDILNSWGAPVRTAAVRAPAASPRTGPT